MKVEIKQGSILDLQGQVDVVVNPANSFGYMGGGIAGVIKKAAGNKVEKQATSFAPIPIGQAILTSAGQLKFAGVIHAPTMENPGEPTTTHKISQATYAALKLAEEKQFKSIAIPGMGTGVGKVPKDKAAESMLDIIINFKSQNLQKVILIDINENMTCAWKNISKNFTN